MTLPFESRAKPVTCWAPACISSVAVVGSPLRLYNLPFRPVPTMSAPLESSVRS